MYGGKSRHQSVRKCRLLQLITFFTQYEDNGSVRMSQPANTLLWAAIMSLLEGTVNGLLNQRKSPEALMKFY